MSSGIFEMEKKWDLWDERKEPGEDSVGRRCVRAKVLLEKRKIY